MLFNRVIILSAIWAMVATHSQAQVKTIQNSTGKTIGWNVLTGSSVYQMMLNDRGEVIPVFFGSRQRAEQLLRQDRARGNGPFQLNEVPVRGGFADKIPIVEVSFADNIRDCELVFDKADMIRIDDRDVLRIVQKDSHYPFSVTSYIRTLPELDMIEKWIEVKNTSPKESIQIENLLSASVLLPANTYYLDHHGGRWLNEFQLQKTRLTTGVRTLQARDFSAFANSPWFAVSDQEDADHGAANVWFGQVHYSGNWRIDLEATVAGHLQIAGGINFWDTQWKLDAGQSFITPKMSFGFTEKGTDEAARLYARYTRNEILRPATKDKMRPVIYNSWYATGFDVNEEGQLKLAKLAKEIGVELFVIDDGWFAGRKDDRAGLGDWWADAAKFPNGLNSLIKKINDLGMDFGIWVEPEMVNPNSELYKKHPDWVFHFPNRKLNEWRHQLTLNLAREDVYQYLLQMMTRLLKNHNIKFVKWDRNRGLSEPGWPAAPQHMQKEVRIRYMNNLYRLIDELKSRFPDVLFESCSSGGGRPDLGMLSRMDQTWTSDNTNPLDRLFIQYGYLAAYPANTMVCWTTGYDPSTINLPLDYIFDVAMQGVLGVGDNILQWNDSKKETAIRKISAYKAVRHLVQHGDAYRLRSPFKENKTAIQYVSADKNEAVVFCYNMEKTMEGARDANHTARNLLLQGLNPEALYQLDDKSKTTVTGAYLMKAGIAWPVTGAYRSIVIRLIAQKAVKDNRN